VKNIYFGMALASSASMFWTITPMFFASAGRRIGAFNVNILRLCMAGLLLGAISSVYVLCKGGFGLFVMPWHGIGWLVASGVTGLVIGDIFYLKALTMLGPRRTLQIFLLSPIVPVAIAWTLLGERLTWPLLSGIVMILAGIAYSTAHDAAPLSAPTAEPGAFSRKGLLLALTASFFQGIGAVLARQAFLSVPGLDPIVATSVRVVAAAIVFCGIAFFMRGLTGALRGLRKPGVALPMTLGAITGPVLGMLLYVSAFKYCVAGVVSTLSSLSPLLILPVIAIRYRVRIRKEAVFGSIVAVAGVAVMALGK
jgi:drug/metabolite transporter (DMT)-like permease